MLRRESLNLRLIDAFPKKYMFLSFLKCCFGLIFCFDHLSILRYDSPAGCFDQPCSMLPSVRAGGAITTAAGSSTRWRTHSAPNATLLLHSMSAHACWKRSVHWRFKKWRASEMSSCRSKVAIECCCWTREVIKRPFLHVSAGRSYWAANPCLNWTFSASTEDWDEFYQDIFITTI